MDEKPSDIVLADSPEVRESLSATDVSPDFTGWQAVSYLCSYAARDAVTPPPLADPSKSREPLEAVRDTVGDETLQLALMVANDTEGDQSLIPREGHFGRTSIDRFVVAWKEATNGRSLSMVEVSAYFNRMFGWSRLRTVETPIRELIRMLESQFDPATDTKPKPTQEPDLTNIATELHEVSEPNSSSATTMNEPTTVNKPDPKDYPTPENFERDKWIFETRREGTPIPQVIRDLEAMASEHNWTFLTDDNSIREAERRYASFVGLPRPKGKRGRPSTRTNSTEKR